MKNTTAQYNVRKNNEIFFFTLQKRKRKKADDVNNYQTLSRVMKGKIYL